MLGAEFKFSKCFCISCVRMFHSTGITQGGHLGASFCTCLKVLKVTLGINWGCLLNWRHLSIVTIVLLLVGWKKDVENAWKCSYCMTYFVPVLLHWGRYAKCSSSFGQGLRWSQYPSKEQRSSPWQLWFLLKSVVADGLTQRLIVLLAELFGHFLLHCKVPRKAVSKTGNVQERDVIRHALSMANDSDVMRWPWLSPRCRCRPRISREISSFK